MVVLRLNSMVEEIEFGNILRIYGTLDNHLSPHGSSVYDFNQVLEILLRLKTADEFGVIWGAEREKNVNKCKPNFNHLLLKNEHLWTLGCRYESLMFNDQIEAS